MKFRHVRLAAVAAEVPQEIWSSDEIEQKLEPVYSRLKLPPGRLALMSGVHERRVWPVGTLPSTPSIRTAGALIDVAKENWDLSSDEIGALIHASVCRDFLEPATASRVHHEVGLPSSAWVYDVSNACLGIVNAALQIAQLIEAGVIRAGIAVGTENARPLLQQTIDHLNQDPSLTRQSIKPAFASLTIGSGSAAWLLCHESICPQATKVLAATALARTEFHDLCQSDTDAGGAAMQPLMETDSETLMAEGIATGATNFSHLLQQMEWNASDVEHSICHQVGARHRQAMLEAMNLSIDRDTVTFDRFGNTGSVALPLTTAMALAQGQLKPNSKVAMLGIGSGINSVMLAANWGETKLGVVGPGLQA